jgi:5-methylcytosine-specific restriction endonuclease McrA
LSKHVEPWFRFYADEINNPVVQSLPGDIFKTWVNCLCVAVGYKNNGILPPVDELAWLIRVDKEATHVHLNRLISDGLIVNIGNGRLRPKDWHTRLPAHAARLPWSKWKEIRESVFERDGFACVYCGEEDLPIECDHIHPVALGGGHELENLATACSICNRSKGSKTVDEWIGA